MKGCLQLINVDNGMPMACAAMKIISPTTASLHCSGSSKNSHGPFTQERLEVMLSASREGPCLIHLAAQPPPFERELLVKA